MYIYTYFCHRVENRACRRARFMFHQHRCYATGWLGGWGGWDVNVPGTLHQHRCYATGWLGGWDVNVPCTLHQHRCYATGWLGGWGGWDVNVPCTLHQHRCYATWWLGGWDVNVPCTLHQHRCYATGWLGGWDVNVPCTLHQHRCYGTADVPWACAHVGCYGTADVLWACRHVGCYGTSSSLLTDGAPCCPKVAAKCNAKHFYVNHSQGEFQKTDRFRNKSLSVHTGTIDSCWKQMKTHIPKSLGSQSNQVPLRIRSWQWRFTHADHSDLFSLCGAQVAKM